MIVFIVLFFPLLGRSWRRLDPHQKDQKAPCTVYVLRTQQCTPQWGKEEEEETITRLSLHLFPPFLAPFLSGGFEFVEREREMLSLCLFSITARSS